MYKFRSIGLLIVAAGLFLGSGQIVNGQSYAGQGIGVKASVQVLGQPLITSGFADTGELGSTGGNISLSSAGASVPGLVSLGNASASTAGSGNTVTSTGGVNAVNVSLPGNAVSVTALSSISQTQCPNAISTGSSNITNLTLNGESVSVSGATNQEIPLTFAGNTIGTIKINEHINMPGGLTVNALHIQAVDPFDGDIIDVVVGSSRTGIFCNSSPAFDLYRGRSYGVKHYQSTLLEGATSNSLADSGPLPTSGGSFNSGVSSTNLLGIISTGAMSSSSSGGSPGGTPNSTQSTSVVNSFGLNVGGPLGVSISAEDLVSTTQCSSASGTASCTGSSSIGSLQVSALGIPINVNLSGNPNQSVDLLGLGRIVINEQSTSTNGQRAERSVNALRVELNVLSATETDTIVASAHSGISASQGSTAADVSLSGRVTLAKGRPLARATVQLMSASGEIRIAKTNGFGYFMFGDIPSNQTYVVMVMDKNHRFDSRIVNLDDSMVNVDFVAKD